MDIYKTLEYAQKLDLNYKKSDNLLLLDDNNSTIAIHLTDIYYIETSSKHNNIEIYFNSYVKLYRSTLKDIETCLDDRFFRCSQSIIVNLNHIVEIKKILKQIILSNGNILYYSRNKQRKLVKKWTQLNLYS